MLSNPTQCNGQKCNIGDKYCNKYCNVQVFTGYKCLKQKNVQGIYYFCFCLNYIHLNSVDLVISVYNVI